MINCKNTFLIWRLLQKICDGKSGALKTNIKSFKLILKIREVCKVKKKCGLVLPDAAAVTFYTLVDGISEDTKTCRPGTEVIKFGTNLSR